MFGFLKYVIFALGLLTVYVLIEHYVVDRGETRQTVADTINQAGNAVVSKVESLGENINENYIQPAKEKAENVE